MKFIIIIYMTNKLTIVKWKTLEVCGYANLTSEKLY